MTESQAAVRMRWSEVLFTSPQILGVGAGGQLEPHWRNINYAAYQKKKNQFQLYHETSGTGAVYWAENNDNSKVLVMKTLKGIIIVTKKHWSILFNSIHS